MCVHLDLGCVHLRLECVHIAVHRIVYIENFKTTHNLNVQEPEVWALVSEQLPVHKISSVLPASEKYFYKFALQTSPRFRRGL